MYNRKTVTSNDSDLLTRITSQPGVMLGKPTIRGLRITVEQLVMALAHGLSEDDLLADYPELERDDIRAALLYAGSLVASERVIDISAA